MTTILNTLFAETSSKKEVVRGSATGNGTVDSLPIAKHDYTVMKKHGESMKTGQLVGTCALSKGTSLIYYILQLVLERNGNKNMSACTFRSEINWIE